MHENSVQAELDLLFWPDFAESPTAAGRQGGLPVGDLRGEDRAERLETGQRKFHRDLAHLHCYVLNESGGLYALAGAESSHIGVPIFDGKIEIEDLRDAFKEFSIEFGAAATLVRLPLVSVIAYLAFQQQHENVAISYLKSEEITAAHILKRYRNQKGTGGARELLLPEHLEEFASAYANRVKEYARNGSRSPFLDGLPHYVFSAADITAAKEGVPRHNGLIQWLSDEPAFHVHPPQEALPRRLSELIESFAAKENVRQIWHVSLDIGTNRARLGLVVDADQNDVHQKLAANIKEHIGTEKSSHIFVLPIGAVSRATLTEGSPMLRPHHQVGIPRKFDPPAEQLERATEVLARIPAADELDDPEVLQVHIRVAIHALRDRNYDKTLEMMDRIIGRRLTREALYELHRLVPFAEIVPDRARWWLGTLGIDPEPFESALEHLPKSGQPRLPRECLDIPGSDYLLLLYASNPDEPAYFEGLTKLVRQAVLSVHRKQPSPLTTLRQILDAAETEAMTEFRVGDITSTPEYLNSISDDLDGNGPAGGLTHQWAKKIFLNPPVPTSVHDQEAALLRDLQLQIAVATLVVARCRFGHLPNRTEVEDIARVVNDLATGDRAGEFSLLRQTFSTGDLEDSDISVENLTAAIYELFEPEYDPGKRITPSVVLLLMFVAIASQVDEAVVRRACAEAVHASARCQAYLTMNGVRSGDYVKIFDPDGAHR